MAIGWLAVLKMVPWADIIRNAPQVADGAKKLWNAVAKKPAPQKSPPENTAPAFSSEPEAITLLQAQLTIVTAEVADLHEQMLASSELIKALAEQNTQLIKHVESNRTKILWLTGAVVILGIVAVAGLI